MITRIGDKIISITKVPDLRNYRGDRVLGLSCTSGRFGYIKLLSDLELPEFWDYISGRCDDSLCSIQKRKVMKLLGLTKEILGTIITTPARASEFLLRHEISHILHHDSDDTRLSESGHLDPYRIGIEARATWEAWKQMKNKYMAKFRVQRMYADNDPGQEKKKSGMGLGTKILAGTGAVAAGLTAAKFGAFGAKAQIGVNKQLMNVGRTFNSEALMNSGASGIAQGNLKTQKKALEGVINSAKSTAANKEKAQGILAELGTDAGREARLSNLKQSALDKYGNTSVANARRAQQSGIQEIMKANEGMKGGQAVEQYQAQNGTIKQVAAKADAAKAAAEAKAAAQAEAAKATEEAAKQQATTATTAAPTSYAMETAFSDTDEDLREAVVIGTGLAALGSGALLMKNGKLGITKKQREITKKAYDKAVARVKRLYKEADRGGNKVQQEATNAAAGKKPFYSKEDKKAAEKYAKENGLSSWQEAAEKLGLKPESYK